MPTVVPNAFTNIKFTDEEVKEATTIPPLFKLYLISLRGNIALGKLYLKFDPDKPHEFIQQEASLAGQLDLLNQLIGE